METTHIISLYWIIAICATYASRHYHGKEKRSSNPLDNQEDGMKRIKTHLQIWFLAPIFLPFFLIYVAIHNISVFIDKNRYRNKPRPLPKHLRRILQYFVLNENRSVISIANYNYDHGTNFTLDQVYGKGYEASLSDEMKEQMREDFNKYYNSNKKIKQEDKAAKSFTTSRDMTDENQNKVYGLEASKQSVRLSLITDSYMDYIVYFKKHEKVDNWDKLLCGLPDLILDKRFVLDDFRPRELNNSVLKLYARERSQPRPSDKDFEQLYKVAFKYRVAVEPLDVFRCITLPFTEEAIWQAFLLSQTYHLVGMRWHGGYEKRTFIVSDKDIAGLEPFPYLSDSQKMDFVHLREQMQNIWTPELCASVSLFDNYAIVSHCWFDNWKGLSQVKWKIKYDIRKKRVVEIEQESEKVLVKYHCGVWF